MDKMVRVAIIGGSGYTGGELLRLLLQHPGVVVNVVTSREFAGRPVAQVHPNLRGFTDMRFSRLDLDLIANSAEWAFLAVPHGASLELVPKLLEVGIGVVDLSADFRLKSPSDYRRWYGREHPYPDLLAKATYGLPELHRDALRGSKLIAVPGCNATAAILSIAPLVKGGAVDCDRIVVDVKVGSSEAGARPYRGGHHPERENAIRPYEAGGHRHAAEVEQELAQLAGRSVRVSLVPHAVSSIRGALASTHAWLAKDLDELSVWKLYAAMYSKEPFVRIVRGHPQYPDPKHVVGSNFADVGFAVEERVGRVTGFAAIDNLVKGGAGQAVQAFNVAVGFPEVAGLKQPPIRPV